ncbi:DUF5638 domain-containing protein [Legionella cincinnatiensis]|uniref:DUF5638 domain-containing protein n=1 Tax=Legionella cincinnatiensis TaxID=28085 RepID=A0A378II14_9GAMM|nr:DUF5638 domain-containing protein [Legionella cincinnatiensis]KTC83638.1 hypothetical protein Lcin_2325 [Legionella cincinnatiensis]STX34402.1 Uncharacterised protein [Legionella cincinnatiensis]
MPYNHRILEQRLITCDDQLSALFATEKELDDKIKQQIKAVQDYYNLSYTKATSAKTVEAIAKSYESFVALLTKVKNKEMPPKEAIDALINTSQSRKVNILFNNLTKACELLFWSATAFSLYMGIFGIALPVLVIQPVLGVAVSITIVGAMLAAAYKALSCFTEFKSLSRHDTEHTNEASLVSFFKPAPLEREVISPINEEINEPENLCFI